MGARIETVIEATPEQVFYVMTDPELSKEWLKGAVETLPLSGPMDRPGARFKQRFRQGGKWSEYEGQITAFEKGKLFAAELFNGPFVSCARYEVEPNGTGTLLHYSLEFRGRTFAGKILSLMLGFMAKVMCRQQVRDLKRFVEERKGQLPL